MKRRLSQVRIEAAVGMVVAVLASSGATGCVVPATKYDEAVSAIRVEQSAHRRTANRLYAIEKRLHAAMQAIDARERGMRDAKHAVSQKDLALSDAQLRAETARKERESTAALVTQLRGELERVGNHLRVFASDKTRLAEELKRAQQRIEALRRSEGKMASRLGAFKALAIAFASDLDAGRAELNIDRSGSELRLGMHQIFDKDGSISTGGRKRLRNLAGAASARDLKLELAVTRATKASAERLQDVRAELTDHGLSKTAVKLVSPVQSETHKPAHAPANAKAAKSVVGGSAAAKAATVLVIRVH